MNNQPLPPENIALPRPQVTWFNTGISMMVTVEFAGCYVVEWAPSLEGPWTVENNGQVFEPGGPLLEIPLKEYAGRYWRVRGVECVATEAPE